MDLLVTLRSPFSTNRGHFDSASGVSLCVANSVEAILFSEAIWRARCLLPVFSAEVDARLRARRMIPVEMSTLVLLIVALVVLALALYLVDLLPIPNSTIKRIIQALCVLAALLFILDRTGIYRSGLMR